MSAGSWRRGRPRRRGTRRERRRPTSLRSRAWWGAGATGRRARSGFAGPRCGRVRGAARCRSRGSWRATWRPPCGRGPRWSQRGPAMRTGEDVLVVSVWTTLLTEREQQGVLPTVLQAEAEEFRRGTFLGAAHRIFSRASHKPSACLESTSRGRSSRVSGSEAMSAEISEYRSPEARSLRSPSASLAGMVASAWQTWQVRQGALPVSADDARSAIAIGAPPVGATLWRGAGGWFLLRSSGLDNDVRRSLSKRLVDSPDDVLRVVHVVVAALIGDVEGAWAWRGRPVGRLRDAVLAGHADSWETRSRACISRDSAQRSTTSSNSRWSRSRCLRVSNPRCWIWLCCHMMTRASASRRSMLLTSSFLEAMAHLASAQEGTSSSHGARRLLCGGRGAAPVSAGASPWLEVDWCPTRDARCQRRAWGIGAENGRPPATTSPELTSLGVKAVLHRPERTVQTTSRDTSAPRTRMVTCETGHCQPSRVSPSRPRFVERCGQHGPHFAVPEHRGAVRGVCLGGDASAFVPDVDLVPHRLPLRLEPEVDGHPREVGGRAEVVVELLGEVDAALGDLVFGVAFVAVAVVVALRGVHGAGARDSVPGCSTLGEVDLLGRLPQDDAARFTAGSGDVGDGSGSAFDEHEPVDAPHQPSGHGGDGAGGWAV